MCKEKFKRQIQGKINQAVAGEPRIGGEEPHTFHPQGPGGQRKKPISLVSASTLPSPGGQFTEAGPCVHTLSPPGVWCLMYPQPGHPPRHRTASGTPPNPRLLTSGSPRPHYLDLNPTQLHVRWVRSRETNGQEAGGARHSCWQTGEQEEAGARGTVRGGRRVPCRRRDGPGGAAQGADGREGSGRLKCSLWFWGLAAPPC